MFQQLPPELNEMIQKQVDYDLLMDSRKLWRDTVDALIYIICRSSFREERNFTFDSMIYRLVTEYQIDLIHPYEDRFYKLDYMVGHSFFKNKRGGHRLSSVKNEKIGELIFCRAYKKIHKSINWVWTIKNNSGLSIESGDDIVRIKIAETKKLILQ